MFWAINNAMWMLVDLRTWSLLSDGAFTLLIVRIFLAVRQPWALVLALLYGADAVLDGCWAMGLVTPGSWARAENMIFLLQLLAASWPGAKGIFARMRQPLPERGRAL